MEADLKQFVKVYAQANNLDELNVAMFAGAMSHKVIEGTKPYADFITTLGQVAPHMLQLVQVLENEGKNK